ncbi:DNA-directed RNA polymerase subunit alpha [Candidatus Babeliales bacterium]|nr:DNA-directed RNA polymerase subunit alpha [Candidatus Babeliales bacterium]
MQKQAKEYKALTLPKLEWDTSKSSANYGELVVSPLEPGFGITLGNSLRRILLSAVEGSAVTSVIINGVNNEFSTLPGVIEDILHVLLNIKGIIIKNKTGMPGKLHLSVKGEGVARVSDIKADDHLELINKDHVIARLASDGELDIQFFVETGRGYRTAKWPLGEKLQEDDRVFLDASFSPIRRVEYSIEKTRVGQAINYDKLILGIETDGSVVPQDAIYYATSVMRTQLEHFLLAPEIPFNEISKVSSETLEGAPEMDIDGPTRGLPVELFLKPIDELEFSVRAHNCLVSAGIKRVIDLVNLTDEEILKIKNFGRKSLREVKEILKAFGLHLGMNIKELDLKKMIQDQEKRKKKDSL